LRAKRKTITKIHHGLGKTFLQNGVSKKGEVLEAEFGNGEVMILQSL